MCPLQEKPCSRLCPAGESAPPVSPSQSKGDFSHPVYKEIALANGHINRMTKEELRIKLSELKLDTRWVFNKHSRMKRSRSFLRSVSQMFLLSVCAEE